MKFSALVVLLGAAAVIGFSQHQRRQNVQRQQGGFRAAGMQALAARINENKSKSPADPAKVLLVEFVDLECRHCRRQDFVLKQVIRQSEGKLGVLSINFPISKTGMAFPLARGAWCAEQWGKRDIFVAEVYAAQSAGHSIDFDSIGARIQEAGLGSLTSCSTSPEARNAVLSDIGLGKQLGISATPTLMIGGIMLEGYVSGDSILRSVRTLERGLDTRTFP